MSSESSDEENLQCLKEATDAHFINDSMFKGKSEESVNCETQTIKVPLKQLPSLRKSKDEDEQFNLFRVTPEFREFVAKRLSKILDASLENREKKDCQEGTKKHEKQLKYKALAEERKDTHNKLLKKAKEAIKKKKQKKIGIKLFRSSNSFLDDNRNAEEQYLMTNPLCQTKPKSSQHIELSPEVLRQIAVEPRVILSKKETLCWSNRFKAKNLFSYKNNKEGVLELVEPKFV